MILRFSYGAYFFGEVIILVKLTEKYIDIIVDVPHLGDRGAFSYLPEKGKKVEEYLPGQSVRVPFGRRQATGFIVGFSSEIDIDKNKIKRISKIINQKPLFTEELLESLRLLSDYYSTSFLSLIKTALPAGVDGSGGAQKKVIGYKALLNGEELVEKIGKIKSKAPAQARILEVFLNSEIEIIEATDLLERAATSRNVLYTLEEKNLVARRDVINRRSPEYKIAGRDKKIDFELNSEQRKAFAKIFRSLDEKLNKVFLLHGVTGSGKTAVYFKLIEKVIENGQGAIMLVPEISLTPYMVDFFYSFFGNKVAVLHSRLSDGERYDEWQRIYQGEAEIVIGARSAIFAPLKNPGIIIIDEEHENSYKQGSNPFYHARGAAVIRARENGIPVVLGSATPSLESYYFAMEEQYEYLTLKERAGDGAMPEIDLIDMRGEIEAGNYGLLSYKLIEAINERLSSNEQVMLFLNRRGFASFILCQECGEAIKCPSCDITLTYHKGINKLQCHYCDYHIHVPKNCPACSSDLLQDFGSGTERLETVIKDRFPEAEVARMDVDTTGKKNSHKEILNRVDQGDIDILVGTQMIAKGHDFHNITLVGVLGTDLMLNLPDFRSSERTYQLITQVSGRAGRGDKKGQVYIQTYNPSHYALQAVLSSDWNDFYEEELEIRSKLYYPPFSRLVRILFKAETEGLIIKQVSKLKEFLEDNYDKEFYYLGPVEAAISKIRGKYRWHLLCFFPGIRERRRYLPEINSKIYELLSNKVDVSVDVDPISML
ncbi:MAG: replication restart helicase PriA [Bacillota bacterium]